MESREYNNCIEGSMLIPCVLLLLVLILGALVQYAFAINGDPSKGKDLHCRKSALLGGYNA